MTINKQGVTPTDLYNTPDKIDWRVPIVIDFETYYDKEYSLSKITMEEYIRCDKFECIGVAVKIGNMPTYFYKGETGIEIIRHIVTITYPNSPVVMQNSAFDCGILAFRYGIHPNFTVDTMVLAKLSGFDRVAGGTSLAKMSAQLEKMGIFNQVKGTEVHNMLGVHARDMTAQQWQAYGDYCKLDVELTYALYTYLLDKVPTSELIMADITTKMYTQPMFEIDVPLLEDYAIKLESQKQAMLGKISTDLGFENTEELHKHLRSSKKFVALLERLDVAVPMKWSDKQEKMIPAVSKTDTEFLELLEHDDELVRTLVETKLGTMSSMEQTRTATFLDIASRGLMPIPLRYASAHTGRYGGCFVAETIVCLRSKNPHDKTPYYTNIINATKDTLIWNGEEFVEHDGVICNGVQEVINHNGLCGTYGHKVFTEVGLVSLGEAKERGLSVLSCTPPSKSTIYPLKGTRPLLNYADGVSVPVYDILNAGNEHKYMANGKLVHNSDKVNLQNLSKRTKEPVLRRSLRAIDNHIIIATDSSSIEARLLAMVANQQDLVETFVQGRDVYIEMATKIYNKSYDEVYEVSKRNPTKEGKAMRNMGKSCILGMGYSMSAQKFSDTNKQQGVDIPLEQAQDLVTIYRTTYNMIPTFWRECNRVLDVMYAGGSVWFGGANNDLFFADGSSVFHGKKIPSIRLPNGTYLVYQNLRKEVKDNGQVSYVYDQFKGRNWLPKYVFGGSLTENLVQAIAFVVLKHQAIEIAKAGIPINLNVHDEWVSVVPREQAPYAVATHYRCMRSVPDYIPQGLLDCEVDVGRNYADLKTINVKKYLGDNP